MESDPPKVLISYSHDTPEHGQHVLELAERLHVEAPAVLISLCVAGTCDLRMQRGCMDGGVIPVSVAAESGSGSSDGSSQFTTTKLLSFGTMDGLSPKFTNHIAVEC